MPPAALLLASLLALAAVRPACAETAAEWFAKGNEAYSKGQYQQAAEFFGKAIQLEPNYASYHNMRGNAYSASWRNEDALREYDEAIRLLPNDVVLHFNRGESQRNLNRCEKALDDFALVVRLAPTNGRYEQERGGALFCLKRYAEAVESFSRAIRLESQRESLQCMHEDRANAFMGLGDIDKAILDMQASIRLKPTAQKCHWLAGALRPRSLYSRLVLELEKAVALFPPGEERDACNLTLGNWKEVLAQTDAIARDAANHEAYYRRAVAFRRMSLVDEALQDYSKAIAMYPRKKWAYYYDRGILRMHFHRGTSEALDDMSEAVRLAPRHPFIRRDRAELYEERGKFREAIADLTEAIELRPAIPFYYYQRGWAYFHLGKYSKAARDFEQSSRLVAGWNFGAGPLIDCYRLGGENAKAVDELSRDIRNSPGCFRCYGERIHFLKKLGRFEDVIRDYTVLISTGIYSGELEDVLYHHRGQAYLRIGDIEKAIADYTSAIHVSGWPWLYYERGVLYERSAVSAKALEDFSKAIELNPRIPWFPFERGKVYASLGQYARAAQDFNTAIRLSPRRSAFLYRRALARLRLGLYAGAGLDILSAVLVSAKVVGLAACLAGLLVIFRGWIRRGMVVISGGVGRGAAFIGGRWRQAQSALQGAMDAARRRRKVRIQESQEEPLGETQTPGTRVPAGQRVGGKYDLIRVMGRGGMAVVYEAVEAALGRKVALKKMREEVRVMRRERDRFLKEARTTAGLQHPNIVRLLTIVEEDDIWLVFEFIEGRTLEQMIDDKGAMVWKDALALARQALAALVYAHRHDVTHRDLKPSNIMVDEEGVVKVMDFGIARVARDSVSRVTGMADTSGTAAYMAPEQHLGRSDARSDLFAFGATLYELLAGEPPFRGSPADMIVQKREKAFTPLKELVSGLPESLEKFCVKCLSPEPGQRFASAAEALAALNAIPAP